MFHRWDIHSKQHGGIGRQSSASRNIMFRHWASQRNALHTASHRAPYLLPTTTGPAAYLATPTEMSLLQAKEFWHMQDQEIRELDAEYSLRVRGGEVADSTLYDLLRVQPGSSEQEIRRAYLRQSLLYHPDTAHRMFGTMERSSGSSNEDDEYEDEEAEAEEIKSDSEENHNGTGQPIGAESENIAERKKQLRKLRRSIPHIDTQPTDRLRSFFEARQAELNSAKETLLDPQRRALYDLFGKDGAKYQSDMSRSKKRNTAGSRDEPVIDELELARIKYIMQLKENPVLSSQSYNAKLDVESMRQFRRKLKVELDKVLQTIAHKKQQNTRVGEQLVEKRVKLSEAIVKREILLKNIEEQQQQQQQQQQWSSAESPAAQDELSDAEPSPEHDEQPAKKYSDAEIKFQWNYLKRAKEHLQQMDGHVGKLERENEKLSKLESAILEKRDEILKSRRQQLAHGLRNFTSSQDTNLSLGSRAILGSSIQLQPAHSTCAAVAFALLHPFTDRSTGDADEGCSVLSQLYHVNNVDNGMSKLFWINRAILALSETDSCSVQLNTSLMESNRSLYTTDWSLSPEKLTVEWKRLLNDSWTATSTTELEMPVNQENNLLRVDFNVDTSLQLEHQISDTYTQVMEASVLGGNMGLSYELKKHVGEHHEISAVAESDINPTHYYQTHSRNGYISDFKLGVRFSKKIPNSLNQVLQGDYTAASESSQSEGANIIVSPAQSLSVGCSLSARDGIVLDCTYKRGNNKLSLPIILSHRAFDWKVLLAVTALPYLGYHLLYKPIRAIYQRRQLLAKRKSNYEASEGERARVAAYLSSQEVESRWKSIIAFEEARGGLLIMNARYGNLQEVEEQEKLQRKTAARSQGLDDEETEDDMALDQSGRGGKMRTSKSILFNYPDYQPPVIDVTKQLQLLVQNSSLIIPECTLDEQEADHGKWKQLHDYGFYDPAPGEDKQLEVIYSFKGRIHKVKIDDFSALRIPLEGDSADINDL